MRLISAVEALKKQPLTAGEAAMLQEFQRQFDLDDDDPLNVVLAMMARSQMIIETAPDLLQQKVVETIELHRTNLRTQAVLTAKEMIADISHLLLKQQGDMKAIWRQRLSWFATGAASMLLVMGSALMLARWWH
ncbi:hypothetical protein [Cupriavidus nantongensis]|uniref:Uncharacterized protein n=1 Tax=Cupriavidus nantongensis TaxID=1796606 RepID=A0A142JIV3_9BURK|nr:hypothetical protein [Cupriavidus nantongensis]AMR78015.1 hypothetical protein A2G96_09820 [Cupriavidus nantongensis]